MLGFVIREGKPPHPNREDCPEMSETRPSPNPDSVIAPDPLELTGSAFVAACRSDRNAPRGLEALAAYREFHRFGSVPAGTSPRLHPIGKQEVEGETIKFTLQLADGVETESVLIPMRRRDGSATRTLCVSSQVGCTLNCSFCHTGTQPLVRNLTTAEIVAQFICDGLLAKIRELPGLPPVHVTRVEITVRTSDVVCASYVRENGLGII